MTLYGWPEETVKRFQYQPTRRDNLRPEVVPFIGGIYTFRFSGTMDRGTYDGQWMWWPMNDDGSARDDEFNYWVPQEDLQEAEEGE